MKSQRTLFKWLAMTVITALLLQFAFVLPSASAQGIGRAPGEMIENAPSRSPEDVKLNMIENENIAAQISDMSALLTGDPTVPWSVQVGPLGTIINDIATDTSGNAYVTGIIKSGNNSDAFVAKLDNDGSTMWSYSFEGMLSDEGWGIDLDSSGNVFVVASHNNSTPQGAILLAKLSNDGSLLWKKISGGQGDHVKDIAIDGEGNIYITGGSQGSWGTPIQPYTVGFFDAFVAKFDKDSGAMIWNTFLGDNLNGFGVGITADSSGNVYVTGHTYRRNSQGGIIGTPDYAFVAGLNINGDLRWYTTVGVTDAEDAGRDIALDGAGNIYVTGNSRGSWGTPLNPYSGQMDAFVAKLSNDGILQWNTFLGGAGFDWGYGIDVDATGNIYIAGPSVYNSWGNPFPSGTSDLQSVFVAKLVNNGTLEWNTFINGGAVLQTAVHTNRVAVQNGSIYVASMRGSLPSGSERSYVTKINDSLYDCSGHESELSNIGQAVLGVVDPQNYCLNNYEGLTFIPTGDPLSGKIAFTDFANLTAQAQYEVDFVNMLWDDEKSKSDDNDVDQNGDFIGDNGPGVIFLQGIKRLYAAHNYPGEMRVRILLGLEHRTNIVGLPVMEDQRRSVIGALQRLGVPLGDPDREWTVEVASYRDSNENIFYNLPFLHSHVKMLIVDGETVIVSGYNMQYPYLNTGDSPQGGVSNPYHDAGIRLSGPIVQDALKVFDELWYHARGLGPCSFGTTFCTSFTTEDQGQVEHLDPVLMIRPGTSEPTVNAFSLFRDKTDKTADNATAAALRAATENINLLQNRFFENFPPDDQVCNSRDSGICTDPIYWPPSIPFGENGPMPYTEAIVDAIQNNVAVQILVSGELGERKYNVWGLENLYEQLGAQNNAGDSLVIKFTNGLLHTKALSIDEEFVIVGSQNFDFSAFGHGGGIETIDLAEYSLGVDNHDVAVEFDDKFEILFGQASEFVIAGSSLQETIDLASPGAIVFVPAGVYYESVTINKPLTLIGDTNKQTVIQPNIGSGPAFRITSSNVSITEITIRRSTGYGIELIDVSPSSLKNIVISNVIFDNNELGGILIQGLISGSPINYSLENNTFIGGQAGVTINLLETQAVVSSVHNNIFVGQSVAPIRIVSSNDGHVEYSYNLFSICGSNSDCAANWHTGNLNSASTSHNNLFNFDPQFMDPAFGDYNLALTSPMIDAGDPNTINEFIFDGNDDGTPQIDIGAFESFLTSDQLPPVTDDAPNIPGMVSELSSSNTNLRYYINPSEDEDWFRFKLTEVGNPQIHLTSLPANYDLYVYNAAGQLLGSSTKDKKAAEMVKITNAIPGYYYVRVVGVDGSWNANNPYQLRFNVPGSGGP